MPQARRQRCDVSRPLEEESDLAPHGTGRQKTGFLRNEPNMGFDHGSKAVLRLNLRSKLSLDIFDQRPRPAKEFPQSPPLVEGFSGVEAGFERVRVAARSARSGRAAVHAAAPFSAHRWRPARPARSGLGPAA